MSLSRSEEIAKNLKELKAELGSQVRLVAVSKTWPVEDIRAAYKAGQRIFGENKVQELIEKAQALSDLEDIEWHFIGRLQSNKLSMLLKCPNIVSIHSIDSIKLLNKLLNKPVDIYAGMGLFLQVNTSGEKAKGGFEDSDELKRAVDLIKRAEGARLQGLMTIGAIRTDNFEASARKSFLKLKKLRDEIDPELELSMGMSQDYGIAIENGADYVRIGSRIFGRRL